MTFKMTFKVDFKETYKTSRVKLKYALEIRISKGSFGVMDLNMTSRKHSLLCNVLGTYLLLSRYMLV